MKIRMKVAVGGTRNGEPWPPAGGDLDLPDHEGIDLCRAGLAEPIADAKNETAQAPDKDVAKRVADDSDAPAPPRRGRPPKNKTE